MYIIKYITFHIEKGMPEPDVYMWDEPPMIAYYEIHIPVPKNFAHGYQKKLKVHLKEGDNNEQAPDK